MKWITIVTKWLGRVHDQPWIFGVNSFKELLKPFKVTEPFEAICPVY